MASIGGLSFNNSLALKPSAAVSKPAPTRAPMTDAQIFSGKNFAPMKLQDYQTYQPLVADAAPAPDPYAAWGGQAGYNQAVSDYGASSAQTNASINERIGSEGTKYGSGILDFIDQNRIGQNSINAKTVQNELSKQQGSAGVLETVGRGVRSGGVMLANKNASNSSAAEALARAWGDFGRREQTGVNNQFVNGQNSINNAQVEFGIQQAQGSRRLGEGKAQVINSIVGDAQTALSALNAQAASASLPDRVNIEQRKAEIRNQTLQALQQYDNQLTQGLSGIKQIDPNAARTQATSMRTAGVAATNPFNYTTDVPQSVQNTGPFASELPIFQYPGARKAEI